MKKLRRKGKFKRPIEKRVKFNIGKTIKQLPKHIYKREELSEKLNLINNRPRKCIGYKTSLEIINDF